MDTGIQISDPSRALRVLLIGGAAALVLVLGLGALVAIPVLSRADRALDALERSLPVVEEQMAPDVAALESYVESMPDDLGSMLSELRGVGEGLDSVNAGVSDLEDPLTAVADQLGGVRDDLQPVGLLRGVLEAVGVLPEVLAALRSTRDAVVEVDGSVDQLNVSMRELLGRFDQMLVLLEEIEKHVENIDRKTGPVVPPAPPEP